MPTVTAVKARDNFSEIVARAACGKERICITNNGRDPAALIPVEDMALLEELEDRRDAAEGHRILGETRPEDLAPFEDCPRKRGRRWLVAYRLLLTRAAETGLDALSRPHVLRAKRALLTLAEDPSSRRGVSRVVDVCRRRRPRVAGLAAAVNNAVGFS